MKTLDLDSRLAVVPKVAFADNDRSRNSMEFVSVELGHRILETEEPWEPKISASEGTVLPGFPGPRRVWTSQERRIPTLDSRLGPNTCLLASFRESCNIPADHSIPDTPHFLGDFLFPLFYWAQRSGGSMLL